MLKQVKWREVGTERGMGLEAEGEVTMGRDTWRNKKGWGLRSKVDGHEKFKFRKSDEGKMEGEKEEHSPKWKTSKARSAMLAAFSDQKLLPSSMEE